MADRPGGFRGMLSTKGAAAHVGLCYTTFVKRLKKNQKQKIPRYRIGTRYFFKTADLDAWVESHRS